MKLNWMLVVSFFCTLFTAAYSPVKGAEPEFRMEIQPDAIYEGEVFEVSLTINREGWGQLTLPELPSFQRVSGPTRSIQTTIIQGRIENRTTHSYRFRAAKSGEFIIPPAVLIKDGRELRSNSATLVVLDRSDDHPDLSGDIFLRVSTSCDTCYMGQQIVLNLELLTTRGITDYSILQDPPLQGLHKHNYHNLRNFRPTRDTFQNRIYQKHLLRRYILTPQHPGLFSSETFELRVVEEDPDSRWGGFFRMGGESHYLSAMVPDILVLQAPPHAPETFNHLIGEFRMNSYLEENELHTGELLTLRIRVNGDGDLKAVHSPEVEIMGGLSIADVQLADESSREYGGKLEHSREWNILLRGDHSGEVAVIPQVTAYHPEADSFYTLRPDTLHLMVKEGDGVSRGSNGFLTRGDEDLHPVVEWWVNPRILIGLTALGVGAALFFLLFYRRNGKPSKSLTSEEVFLQSLRDAKKIQNSRPKEYCTQVLHALDYYISQSIDLPMSRWSEDRLKTSLLKRFDTEKSEAILELRSNLIRGTYGYSVLETAKIERLINKIT